MAASNNKRKFKISFNLGFRESLGIILCALLFFVLPISVIEYNKQHNPARTETYTEAAINSAQGDGRVAGISTASNSVNNKYFLIPIINFKFDKTLSETSTIFFLFGSMLLIGGTVLGITVVANTNKKMITHTPY